MSLTLLALLASVKATTKSRYETVSANSGVPQDELCDTDIKFYRSGYVSPYFLFEFELDGSWDQCVPAGESNNGPGRFYIVEMETDGDDQGDYVLVYDPQDLHCDTDDEGGIDTSLCDNTWRNAGSGDDGDSSLFLWQDLDGDWGSTQPTMSDNPPSDYTAYEEELFPEDVLWVRIVTRPAVANPTGKNVVQLAVHEANVGSPGELRSRGWSSSDSNINNATLPYHDPNTSADMNGNKFDNVCSADTGVWPPSGPSATPITVDSVRLTNSGRRTVVERSTANEVINAGFNIYGLSRHGWERLNGELIPSASLALLEPQDYRYEVQGGSYERFQLADVDFQGRERRHGPFAVGELYGEKVAPRRIDWASIRSEQENQARIREAQRQLHTGAGSKRRAASPHKRTQGVEVEFEVDRTGIYRVTYSELKAAGFDLAGISARSLSLVSRGQTVPIRVHTGRNGPTQRHSRLNKSTFGPGGFVEFYGEDLDSLYTRTNLYRLVAGSHRAKRIVPIRPELLPISPPRSITWRVSKGRKNATTVFRLRLEIPGTTRLCWQDQLPSSQALSSILQNWRQKKSRPGFKSTSGASPTGRAAIPIIMCLLSSTTRWWLTGGSMDLRR